MQFQILQTTDDGLLADFYYRHWIDMGTSEHEIHTGWRETALSFIANARANRAFTGFIAIQNDTPIGSACCQLVDAVYPPVIADDSTTIGYVWGVYVAPSVRGHGIGEALVLACAGRMASLGCPRILLHAGERSRPLYSRLGFRDTDEMAMRLDL